MEIVCLDKCAFTPRNVYSSKHCVSVDNTIFKGTTPVLSTLNTDTVSFKNQKEIYLQKLNELFPNGELDRIYNSMNAYFGIDKPAKLDFNVKTDGVAGGGYTFRTNEINLSLEDLLDSDTKIVGVKNGKETTLVSPTVLVPLFVDKANADQFVAVNSRNGNYGYDQLKAVPLSKEEQKKLIVQKLAHEVIHAQQHMVMRQTEGIGEKEILKAWTHKKPANLIEKAILEYNVSDIYNNSYWSGQMPTVQKISADSDAGKLAKTWLEAVRNYPNVDSPEYLKNAIEIDAYKRSADYVKQFYGDWN